MVETDAALQRLVAAEPLRTPLLRQIIQSLRLPTGSRGLDAGCGTGHQALLLADAIGPAGHLHGLDISPALLDYAATMVRTRGLGKRISLHEGDLGALPFPDASLDWAWSADCVGYPAGDALPQLHELARVLRPGGSLYVLAWTSQSLLPGYPQLEARLNAACSTYAPYLADKPPATHFFRLLGTLRRAGLVNVAGQTFAAPVQAPLVGDIRGALAAMFEMLWDERQPALAPEDRDTYRRLSAPDSPDWILGLADYYGFFTYTLFRGQRPSSPADGS